MATKKEKQEDTANIVKQIFKSATPSAARLLVDTMNNDELPLNTRLDAAKEIMSRLWGRAGQPIEGDGDSEIVITLSPEVKKYAN